MQIVETTNEGLKRAYTLTIPATTIDAAISAEVKKISPQVKMPGFRPGKVPANLVRKMHGEAIHADVFNTTLRESIDGLIRAQNLRPALQPRIEIQDGYAQGQDAQISVEVEVLPEFDLPPIDGLTLEKLVVPISDEALDEALARLAGNQKSYADAEEGRKAETGDQLIIDFTGSLDGVEFEGGKAEDAPLVLGSGQFIPGFEEQLIGAAAGEQRTIAVTFPDDYPAQNLKGRLAQFAINVKQVKIEAQTLIDEQFAQNLGLESLEKLRELMRGQLEQESEGLTRTQMKRQLLDKLAAQHDFPVPASMVEAEFNQIWQQLEAEAAREDDPQAAKAEIEAEKDDYRRIAERRVRLGLLLSEIGQKNQVEVSAQELQMLIQQAAQQYRAEDRQRFVDYVRQDPMALAQLRAPLYEEKVVDFLFDKAEVTTREVTREELEAAIEADETGGLAAGQGAEPESTPPSDSKAKAGAGKGTRKQAAADTEHTDGPQASELQATTEEAGAEAPAKKAPAKKKAPARKASAEKGQESGE